MALAVWVAGIVCAALLAAWDAVPSTATVGAWVRASMTDRSTSVSTPDSTEHGAGYYQSLPHDDPAPEYWGPARQPQALTAPAAAPRWQQ
jgi:hypothetical protein